jgi:hypothetical protein
MEPKIAQVGPHFQKTVAIFLDQSFPGWGTQ